MFQIDFFGFKYINHTIFIFFFIFLIFFLYKTHHIDSGKKRLSSNSLETF